MRPQVSFTQASAHERACFIQNVSRGTAGQYTHTSEIVNVLVDMLGAVTIKRACTHAHIHATVVFIILAGR